MKRIIWVFFLFLFFCPSISQAIETDVKLIVISKTMEKMADHLEFLGYRIEKKPTEEGVKKPYLLAQHPSNYSMFVIEFIPNFYLFRTNLSCSRSGSQAMNDFINKANKLMEISRIFYDPIEETKGTIIRIETIYIGEYQKQIFASFMEMLKKDQERISTMENYEKIFLKEK